MVELFKNQVHQPTAHTHQPKNYTIFNLCSYIPYKVSNFEICN